MAPPAVAKTSQKKTAKKVGMTLTQRAGTMISVSRVLSICRSQGVKLQKTAAVCLTGSLEYLAAELVELSQEVARETNAKSVQPKHLRAAVTNDEELQQVFRNVTLLNAPKSLHAPKKSVTGKTTQ